MAAVAATATATFLIDFNYGRLWGRPGFSDFQADSRIAGFPNSDSPDFSDFVDSGILGSPDPWIPGFPHSWIGFMDPWIPGSLDQRIPGCLDSWIPGFL